VALRTAGSLVLVTGALVAGGCGGDGGGGRLTKAQLIQRADAICGKYRAKNEALNAEAPARNPTDPRATDEQVRKAAPVLRKVADNVRGANKEFGELEPPRDVESDWQNTLDDLKALASELDDAADAASTLDRQRVVNDFGEILRLNRRVNQFERDYGFRTCGSS
jgi:hypothetical protein